MISSFRRPQLNTPPPSAVRGLGFSGAEKSHGASFTETVLNYSKLHEFQPNHVRKACRIVRQHFRCNLRNFQLSPSAVKGLGFSGAEKRHGAKNVRGGQNSRRKAYGKNG